MADRPRVAIIGAGVSGLTAAYLLSRTHAVTLFEREPRLGGHAHTHDVTIGDTTTTVDSGFIVLNDRTYPTLRRLFDELGVAIRPTEMSMSIRCSGCGLAFVGGRGVRGIFAQRRRVLDPRFWRLLLGVRRFQKLAMALLADETAPEVTYGQFLEQQGFSEHFIQHYAVPIVSCVWSSGRRDAMEYPAAYLFAFLSHHGFLALSDAPQWYVVAGGSRTYVEAVNALLAEPHSVRAGQPAVSVDRHTDGVRVTDAAGGVHTFDRVVLATHADEALALLADPTPDEKIVLSAFRYSANTTQLHRDDSVLADRWEERASWNFTLDGCADDSDRVQVSYWMNRLQHQPAQHPLVVTLNGEDRVDPANVIATMDYTHPVYTPESVAAQTRLTELMTDRTAYAGAYHGWGFHEDGCRAGVRAAQQFGVSW